MKSKTAMMVWTALLVSCSSDRNIPVRTDSDPLPCRATVPTTVTQGQMYTLFNKDFGADLGLSGNNPDALFLGLSGTLDSGKAVFWLGKYYAQPEAIGWNEAQIERIYVLLARSGWSACKLNSGAFAERNIDGQWINVRFDSYKGHKIALAFSNYGDEALPINETTQREEDL